MSEVNPVGFFQLEIRPHCGLGVLEVQAVQAVQVVWVEPHD